MAIFGGCNHLEAQKKTLHGPHADSAGSNCWLCRPTTWWKSPPAGIFCPRMRNARTTGLRAHSTPQTGSTAAQNKPSPRAVRSGGPETEGDEMPGSNEDGDQAAGQGNEQGMNASSLMNFVFGNANSQKHAVER